MAGAFQYGGPSPMQLANYVQGQGQMGKQQGEDSRLARLVSGAMADPSKRQANLAEVASFRPDAAFAAQDKFNSQDDRRYAELGKKAAVLVGAPEAMRGQVWAQLRPQLEQEFGMTNLPDMPTPEVLQTAQQLASVYGGQSDATNLPSSVREAMAFRADPSLLETRRQMYGSYSYGEVPLPDGTVAQTRRNSRTGQMEMVLPGGRVIPMADATPTAGGQPQGAPAPVAAPEPSRVYTAQYAPGEESDPFAQLPEQEQQLAMRLTEAGMQFTVQNGRVVPGGSAPKPGFGPNGAPPTSPQPAPSPRLPSINDIGGGPIAPLPGSGRGGAGFGRPAEAEAAAKRAAELETDLAYADRKAEADARAARLKKEAEAAGERTAQAPKRIAAYRQALAGSENVLKAIDDSLSLIGPTSTGFVGARLRGVEGSQAYNLAANIETIKANLGFDRLQQMRDNSPTGGALGAIAVQELTALQSTIANLDPNQSDTQIRANLDKVKGHYEKWQKAVEQSIREEEGGGQQASSQYAQMSDDEIKRALGL